jgi:hypothetical protein
LVSRGSSQLPNTPPQRYHWREESRKFTVASVKDLVAVQLDRSTIRGCLPTRRVSNTGAFSNLARIRDPEEAWQAEVNSPDWKSITIVSFRRWRSSS